MHHCCCLTGPRLPTAQRDVGCCFSSNSPSIDGHRGAGAGGLGGSSSTGPGTRGRGKGPCQAAQPRHCESPDISYRPLQQLPLLACGCRARCTQGKWRPGRLPSALCRAERRWSQLCARQAAACCPAMPVQLSSIQLLVGLRRRREGVVSPEASLSPLHWLVGM